MGELERRELGEKNRERRNAQATANYPRRIVAFVLLLLGTAAGAAIATLMNNEMQHFESITLSGPVPRCIALGTGLALLCFLSGWHSHVVAGPNDVQLLGWTHGVREVVLSLLVILLSAIGGVLATVALVPRFSPTIPGRLFVIAMFVVLAWQPIVQHLNNRFRVTRTIRAWNYRVKFTKRVTDEWGRVNERHSIGRRLSMVGNAIAAFCVLPLGMMLIGVSGAIAARGEHLSASTVAKGMALFFVTSIAAAACGVGSRRRYQRKPPFRSNDRFVTMFRVGLIGLFGTIGGSAICVVGYGIGYVLGWPIGAVISFVVGMVLYLAMQIWLIGELYQYIDRQEKDEAQQREMQDSEPMEEAHPQMTRSGDSASIEELFAKPDGLAATPKENTREG